MVKSKKKKYNSKNNTKFDEKVTAFMGSIFSIIVHSIVFLLFLTLPLFSEISYDSILLILTTIVSLEAIYLALFIQISLNRQTQTLEEVSDDIDEIQEDVEELQEDMEEQEKEELLEEEIEKTEDEKEEQRKLDQKLRLEKLENMLINLLHEIGDLKK